MITTWWIYLLRRGLKRDAPAGLQDITLATEDDIPLAEDGGLIVITDPEE